MIKNSIIKLLSLLSIFIGITSNAYPYNLDSLATVYANALDNLILENEQLLKEGRLNEINYFLDLRNAAVKKAAPLPEGYTARVNKYMNEKNNGKSDKLTSFYVLLTSEVSTESDNELVNILTDLDNNGSLENVNIKTLEDLFARHAAMVVMDDIHALPPMDNGMTKLILSKSRLGNDNRLSMLLHYRHLEIVAGLKLCYTTSLAFDADINEITRNNIRNEIIDPEFRNGQDQDRDKYISHTSLFKIFEHEIQRGFDLIQGELSDIQNLYVREATDLLDQNIEINNSKLNKSTFNSEGLNYLIQSGSRIMISSNEKLNKKLAYYEFKTGKQFYIITTEGKGYGKEEFAKKVFERSKKINKSNAVLVAVQYESFGPDAIVYPSIYSPDEKLIAGSKDILTNTATLEQKLYDVYTNTPKLYTSYVYFFRIDGQVLFKKNVYAERTGEPDITSLKFFYDKKNVETYVNILFKIREPHTNPILAYFVKNTTAKNQYEYALKNPSLTQVPIDLKEEYIDEYHQDYINTHLYLNYKDYFDIDFPAIRDIPSDALYSNDNTDPIALTLDAASMLLAPFGIDAIPDALGGVYYTIKGDYVNASISYTCAATVFIPAGVAKGFLKGGEVVIQGGKAFIKTRKPIKELLKEIYQISDDLLDDLVAVRNVEYLVMDEDLIAAINKLGDSKNALFKDFIGNPEMLEKIVVDLKLLEAWEVIGRLPDNIRQTLTTDDIIKIRKHLNESGQTVAELQKEIPKDAAGVRKWVDELGSIGKDVSSTPRRTLKVKDPSKIGSVGGTIKIELVDDAGNLVGELKRVPGSGGQFNYYFTDYSGVSGLVKNQQYSLQSKAKILTSSSPGNYSIPNGQNILYMDFNLPKNISDNYGGLGKIMFEDAFAFHNRNGNLNGIYGEWIKSADLYADYGGMSINLKKFQEALNAGMTREQAAFKTITGEWAESKGFNKVEFRVPPTENRVDVIFRE